MTVYGPSRPTLTDVAEARSDALAALRDLDAGYATIPETQAAMAADNAAYAAYMHMASFGDLIADLDRDPEALPDAECDPWAVCDLDREPEAGS